MKYTIRSIEMKKLIWGLRMEVIATQLPLFQLDQTSVSITDEKSIKVNNIEAYKNIYEKESSERERESTGSWRTGLVSSFAGVKGGLVLLLMVFDLIEDCERVLFIVYVSLCCYQCLLHYSFLNRSLEKLK